MTKFLNISTDNTLGGSSPSDETVSSQKAVKDYVDTQDGNFVTLNTLQTITSGKKIFANDTVMAGNQTALLATISNSKTSSTDTAWVGRYICGAKNLTFLMGTFRNMAGIGAHSWTNAQTGSGAGWADFYLNPDGGNTVYIGGYNWTKDSGWFKVKNTASNTGGTIQVNKGSITSPSWKDVAYKSENISDFTNDAGYTTNVGTVTSVNNTSPDSNGNVSLSIPTVNNPTITFTQGGTTKGTITLNQSGDQTIAFDAGGSGGGAVDSVNGKTGVVVLDYSDVGALPDTTVIPTVDQTYSSTSTNAQSGTAVASAVSGKQDTITGGATTITSSNLTTNRALISNASGKVAVSTTTSTELGYVHGVTSAIQTQLNGKVDGNTSITGATKCKITYDSKGLVTAGADLGSSDITTALGYTPYDASNPNGYTSNVGTVTSVNNVSPVNGNVTLSIPSIDNLANKDLSNLSTTGNSKFQAPLVSGTNIKTINNTSILGSGNISIQADPAIDSKSITKNTSDQLQTVGVIDQNSTSTALKQWSGTKAQYDAITTKDANTLYNITDDSNPFQNVLETIYPVGSIYIGTMDVCPLSALFGTWTVVGTKILTDNPSSVPVKGNGKTIGLTNGTTNAGMSSITTSSIGCIPQTTSYNISIDATQPATGNYVVGRMGITTNSDESGIVADMSSVSNIVVNIWQRTA